jgi:WD40 repeat protein
LRIDLKTQLKAAKGNNTSQVASLSKASVPSGSNEPGLRSLSVSTRSIVGSSKVAIFLADRRLWCWNYSQAPHLMSPAATVLSLALSDDGQWVATGHSDCTVNIYGPLVARAQCINGTSSDWKPKCYPAIHSRPVQSVTFMREVQYTKQVGWILCSAGADREIHRLRIQGVGSEQDLPEFVAGNGNDGRFCEEDSLYADQIHSVCVSQDRQLCFVAIGTIVKVFFFPDLCLKGEFTLLTELKDHEDTVLCLCMNQGNADGIQTLFTGSSDNTARIWGLNSKLLPVMRFSTPCTTDVVGPLASSVTSICVDRYKARFIFLGLADGSIEIWSWQNNSKKQLQRLQGTHSQPVVSLSTNTSRRLVSGSADNTAVVWENAYDPKDATCDFGFSKRLTHHDGNVNAVYIGYKGRKIVSASTDTNVLFWDIENLEAPRIFKGHQAAVMTTCTSHDMQTVLSGDQSGVVIEWDVISGSIRKCFHAFSGQDVKADDCIDIDKILEVRSICLVEQDLDAVAGDTERVENGRWLIVVTAGALRVKRLDAREYTVRKGHIHHVSCVAMSNDNTSVVSASWDGMLVLWDAVNKTQLSRFTGHLGPVFCCDISCDNKYIFSGSADTTIIVWEREHAKPKRVLSGYHDEPVECLKMVPAPEGEYLRFATGSMDHKVNLFGMKDSDAPMLLAFIRHPVGVSCVIGPRHVNDPVGIGTVNGEVILWKPKVPESVLQEFDNGTKGSLAPSPSTVTDDRQAAVIDQQVLRHHEQTITSVYFAEKTEEGGSLLLATSVDGEASAWWDATGRAICSTRGDWQMTKSFSHPGNPAVNFGRFSEQQSRTYTLLVILGCEDKSIYIWDYRVHVIEKVLRGHLGPVCDLEISKDGRLLISAAREQRILRWNLVRGTADQQLIGHDDGVVVTEVSHSSQTVVSGAKDNRIIVWNTVGPSAGTPRSDLLLHSGNVSCLSLSRDGSLLLSGSWDTQVCLTDLQTPQTIRRFRGHVGAVLGCVIGGQNEDVLVSCCRSGSLIRWSLESGKPEWKVRLGGPARCLTFRPDNLIVVGCDTGCAIQLWDCSGTAVRKPLEEHQAVVTSLAFAFNDSLLCSADQAGKLIFWDAEHNNFVPKGAAFSNSLMSEGVESLAVKDDLLVLSTSGRHVLLFRIDASVGLMPGTMPSRVWRHHLGRVPCVRILAPEVGEPKVVSASYDGRVLLHPIGEGSSLWFSWRPIMNAARSQDYSLFRHLLWNQPSIVHEKVYPVGWTLLHALSELGDQRAIQELMKLSGDEPLGFTSDATLRTALDICYDNDQTGILDYLLSEASKWPKHVLEFNTTSICAIVPMGISSMPSFLDSRMFEPLSHEDEKPPRETLLTDDFNAITAAVEYFEAIGMGGSMVPSMSLLGYAKVGMVLRSIDDLHLLEESAEEHALHAAGTKKWQLQLYFFLRGHFWTVLIALVVLGDFILTLVSSFVKGVDGDDLIVKLLGYFSLFWFFLDIILRMLACGMKFFRGPDKHMNTFELFICIICVVLEVSKSSFPASFGRLIRPCMRSVKLLRSYTKVMIHFITGKKTSFKVGGTVPISAKCIFLHGIMDHNNGILHHLVNCRQADIFRSTAVRAILEFKWQQYAKSHHIKNFAVFAAFAVSWTGYATIIYMPDRGKVDTVYKNMMSVIMMGFSIRYLVYEAAKLWRRGIAEYLASIWNILNFATSCIASIVVFIEISTLEEEPTARRIAAGATPLVWLQSFNYLRGFRGTGALVRMISQIVVDIKFFMLVMVIITFAFTQSFYMMRDTGIFEPLLEDEELSEAAIKNPGEIGWQVYNTALIGSQWSDYVGPQLQRYLYVFMTLFQLAVLMNLLICIMTDTFVHVKSGATVEFYRNLAQLIYELEVLMTPAELKIDRNFPEYMLYSTKEVFGDFEEGAEFAKHDEMHSVLESMMQAQTDLKSVKRQQDRIVDVIERLQNGSGSATGMGTVGSPRHQFHV